MALSTHLRSGGTKDSTKKKRYPFAFDPSDPSTWWKQGGKLTADAKLRQTERQKYAEAHGWVKHGEDFSNKKVGIGNRADQLRRVGLLPPASSSGRVQRGHLVDELHPSGAQHNPASVTGGSPALPGYGSHTTEEPRTTGGAAAPPPAHVLHAAMQRAGVPQREARNAALTHALAALQVAMDTESHVSKNKSRAFHPIYYPAPPKHKPRSSQPVLVDELALANRNEHRGPQGEYHRRRRRSRGGKGPIPGRPSLSASLRSVY